MDDKFINIKDDNFHFSDNNSAIKERVNLIASHMFNQYKEHQEATINTSIIFNKILSELGNIVEYFKESFEAREINTSNIFCEVDADRSVGIINILWHSISFTTRGNTKPQALYREGNPPLFTGRIIALNGDFQDACLEIQDQEYPDILNCEIASLFVPADKVSPAILKIKHLGDEEIFLNQIDASKLFTMKVLEIICGGGFYHESAPDNYEEEKESW